MPQIGGSSCPSPCRGGGQNHQQNQVKCLACHSPIWNQWKPGKGGILRFCPPSGGVDSFARQRKACSTDWPVWHSSQSGLSMGSGRIRSQGQYVYSEHHQTICPPPHPQRGFYTFTLWTYIIILYDIRCIAFWLEHGFVKSSTQPEPPPSVSSKLQIFFRFLLFFDLAFTMSESLLKSFSFFLCFHLTYDGNNGNRIFKVFQCHSSVWFNLMQLLQKQLFLGRFFWHMPQGLVVSLGLFKMAALSSGSCVTAVHGGTMG